MIQHAVPQQISAFQFRLFGNLTIREFAFVGGGFLVSFIIFVSPLPFFLKFPLILIFGGGGAALGLLPIQGRPFDQWILNFIRAILSPTQRIWRKKPEIPYFLQPATLSSFGPTLTPFTLTESRLRLEEYLKKIPQEEPSSFDVAEQMFLEQLDFQTPVPAQVAVSIPPKTDKKPTEKEQVLLPVTQEDRPISKEKTNPKNQSNEFPIVSLTGLEAYKRRPKPKIKGEVKLASEINFVKEPVFAIPSEDAEITLQPGVGQIRVRRLHSPPPLSGEIKIPIRGERRFELTNQLKTSLGLDAEIEPEIKSSVSPPAPPKPNPKVVIPSTPPTPPTPIQIKKIAVKDAILKSTEPPAPQAKIEKAKAKTLPPLEPPLQVIQKTEPVSFEPKKTTLPESKPIEPPQPTPPNTPPAKLSANEPVLNDQPSTAQPAKIVAAKTANISPITHLPNVLNGIVLDSAGGILENAIILVKNEAQTPVRALKTNKLGQFAISTPLPNGKYTIEVEKEGYSFDIIEVHTQGAVIPAIEVKAK